MLEFNPTLRASPEELLSLPIFQHLTPSCNIKNCHGREITVSIAIDQPGVFNYDKYRFSSMDIAALNQDLKELFA